MNFTRAFPAALLLGCSTPSTGSGGAGSSTHASSSTGDKVPVTVSTTANATTTSGSTTTSSAMMTASSATASSSTGAPPCLPTASEQQAACESVLGPHNGCVPTDAMGAGCASSYPVDCDFLEVSGDACVADPNVFCRIVSEDKQCPGSWPPPA